MSSSADMARMHVPYSLSLGQGPIFTTTLQSGSVTAPTYPADKSKTKRDNYVYPTQAAVDFAANRDPPSVAEFR